MKVKFPGLFRFCIVIFTVCFSAFVINDQSALAQQRDPVSKCEVGVHAPPYGSWTWPANSQVKVFIVASGFKPAEIPYLLRPLETWNAVANLTTSGVNFVYTGTASEVKTCDNCLTIMRGTVVEKRHAAEFQAASKHADQLISYAKIILDPRISDLSALTNAVAHEIGHTFNLLDCYSCHKRSTIMGLIRKSSSLEGPTPCDVAQIKSAYDELKLHVRPTPAVARIFVVDEGEEPVEDDTPIVIPPF
ncbi:MAG TPA: hypothetical protein VMZ30_13840 [Pyrinomonadaceae bacterium]|nr:hypothetical protein [Pyrinomonadaceae bacterium]